MAEDNAEIRAEFEQLLKEYRNIEANRKAYADESMQIIRKQETLIFKLKKEIEGLKAEVDLEQRFISRKTGPDSQLTMLQDQEDQYTQKLEMEKQNTVELKRQIGYMKEKILRQRRSMGGVNAAKENQKMVEKQVRILENRLDKAVVKFNEALAENKTLRETIDNLRRERVVFDNIYRKLEKELHEKKKQMANIIEQSNQAYEQRDGAQFEIAAMQQQLAKEAQDHDAEIAELDRILEKEAQKEEDAKERMRGELSATDEERRARMNKGQWATAKDKAAMQVTMDKVQSYEDAFNKIRAATGISEIEALVTTFIQNEDQNFSLFNYVNEQNNEIEKVEEHIQTLREEEHKYTQESGDDLNQHKQLLKDLEGRLQSTEASAERYEQRFQEAQKTVNALKLGIQTLFEKIECNSSAMSEMLGDSMVTETNLMQFLGMIEQRSNEILQMFAAAKQANEKAAEEAASKAASQAIAGVLGQGPVTPMGVDTIHITPPNLDDYSSESGESEDEGDARPLSMKELKDKTLKTIALKANQMKGGRRGRKRG